MNTFLALLIAISILYLFYRYIYDGTEYIRSKLDGKYYKVKNILNAEYLAILNMKLNLIVSSLENSEYSSNENVKRLISNWKKGVTLKEIGNLESEAAYVINKQYMSFCLKVTNTIDSINLMTYVGIHELAHVMSVETGHGSEFIKNFEFLLNYAKTIQYYDPILKTNLPVYIQLNKLNTADNYCGVSLQNSIN
jgi:predicted metal-dependent hydrolase